MKVINNPEYEQAEYEVAFKDRNGKSIEGVLALRFREKDIDEVMRRLHSHLPVMELAVPDKLVVPE